MSDASPELRSPVAAIRTELEVALVEGEAADWPVVARTALGEEARLERLIDEVEAIWAPIAEADDWSLFDAKIKAIRRVGAAMRGEASITP